MTCILAQEFRLHRSANQQAGACSSKNKDEGAIIVFLSYSEKETHEENACSDGQ